MPDQKTSELINTFVRIQNDITIHTVDLEASKKALGIHVKKIAAHLVPYDAVTGEVFHIWVSGFLLEIEVFNSNSIHEDHTYQARWRNNKEEYTTPVNDSET